MRLFGVFIPVLFLLVACGSSGTVSSLSTVASPGIRLYEAKTLTNASLEAIRVRAEDGNTWVHDQAWSRFNFNYYTNAAYRYTVKHETSVAAIAKKFIYGSRYISQAEYEGRMQRDFAEVENNTAGKQKIFKQLTNHANLSKLSAESRKVAEEIRELVNQLDAGLRLFTSKDIDGNFDLDLSVTAIIDTRNKQGFVLRLGDADIPQEPIE